MVKIRKKLVLGAIISLILITGIAISFLPHTAKALPSTETNYQGYSGMFGEALHNYSQRTSYSSQQPQITFLVHGQGGTRSAWSNVNNKLDYDNISMNFSVDLPDLSTAYGQNFEQNMAMTFVKSYISNTIKTIQVNPSFDVNIYENGNLISTSNEGSVDILMKANVDYYFEIRNNSTSNVILQVNVKDVPELSLDSYETTELYGSKKYVSFKGETVGNYTFSLELSNSNESPAITIYSVDVSGFGILGGIVGVNSLNVTIQSCTNKANITYSFDTESGCAGGIAGKNTLNGIITNCINEGTIGYGGERETNPHNRPCMAQIIGWNQQGTVEGGSCNGHTDFNHMTLGQKKYCSNKAVGKTGD